MEMRAISYASSHAFGVTFLKAESRSSSPAISVLRQFFCPLSLSPCDIP